MTVQTVVDQKLQPRFFASILVVLVYLTFTILAYLRFPDSFSPLTHWLSDLGSYDLNPGGAIFYSAGLALAGVSLMAFFIWLPGGSRTGHKLQKVMFFLSTFFGILGSIAMVMIAVFPINLPAIHSFWSTSFYILTGTAFIFSVAAFRYNPNFPRWLLFFGSLVCLVNIGWCLILNVFPMEWLTVGCFLAYILLVGVVRERRAG